MFKKAYDITGFGPPSPEKLLTLSIFSTINKKNPNLTLDAAILIFENAPEGVTLEEYATHKQRNASGYRNVFIPFFHPTHRRLNNDTLWNNLK